MAKRTNTVKKARKGVSKRNKFAELDQIGDAPEWDNVAPEDVYKLKQQGYNHYRYFYNTPDLKKNLFKWLEQKKYSRVDIQAVRVAPDSYLNISMLSLATMLINGMPDTEENETQYLTDKVAEIIAYGKTVKQEKKETVKSDVKKPTIQDRLREQLSDTIAHIESWEDNIMLNSDDGYPNILEWLKDQNVPQVHVNKIIDFFRPRVNEINAAQKNPSDDLKEAYAHFKKADFTRFNDFYADLFSALNAYYKLKSVKRKTRAKKTPSKNKLTEKMTYKQSDSHYNVVSIDPKDIVGAEVLWVFNTKTRKLGVYRADPTAGQLSVKGTTIVGYDEDSSVCKTVRKPEEVLPRLLKIGKVAQRKFLDEIKAVPVKMKGRTNKDTVLLKVY